MRRICLAMTITLLGCAEAHLASDAGVSRDIGRVDAPVCPDRDGDGFASASCGGDDCDDTRGELSPTASLCSTSTEETRCERGTPIAVVCVGETPVCDARVGRCAAAACGDGIEHTGEECDDGNTRSDDGCADCLLEPCTASSQCTPSRPWCSRRTDDGTFRCQAPGPGTSQAGENCVSNDECITAWCDESQGKCGLACDSETDCGAAPSICSGIPEPSPGACSYQCFSALDCRADRFCLPEVASDHGVIVQQSFCETRDMLMVQYEDGDRLCRYSIQCDSGACAFSAGGCSVMCRTDSDCADPSRPYCVEIAFFEGRFRPERFWAEYGRLPRFCGDGRPRATSICFDYDGDREAGASCGGTDCYETRDDADAVIGCVGATQVDACVGAVRTLAECPAATPFCRYPDGVCVVASDACGDRFLHPGEECDDGNHLAGDGCNECNLE